ncbi:OLC1v1001118C1 [Oldenlandia corymbosa var. corymbosa]|uniref:OLC1v1001118C1 n=1 Tax=Oldenlandia corymbosa var. corymbosa TaxID=529605 RepID=A0AAV1D4X7_OLDCO|nr:OLC1v1001118C1 [Oldenlandia corymbosa var. corymbosa]
MSSSEDEMGFNDERDLLSNGEEEDWNVHHQEEDNTDFEAVRRKWRRKLRLRELRGRNRRFDNAHHESSDDDSQSDGESNFPMTGNQNMEAGVDENEDAWKDSITKLGIPEDGQNLIYDLFSKYDEMYRTPGGRGSTSGDATAIEHQNPFLPNSGVTPKNAAPQETDNVPDQGHNANESRQ